MSRHVETFLEMMAVERGASPHTLDAYGRDLAMLSDWLGGVALERADIEALRGFLRDQAARGMAPRTAARRRATLRRFYAFLAAEGLRPDNPADVLDAPRRDRTLPKLLSEDEVDRLLAAARAWEGANGLRASALLELVYAAGLRVSELVSLPLAAVSRDPAVLLIRGKGDKDRMVPIGEPARDAVKAYLPCAKRLPGTEGGGANARCAVPVSLAGRGRPSDPRRLRQDAVGAGGPRRGAARPGLAPCAAACLRHPPAEPWRRSARGSGHAGPCRHQHHPNLYPCPGRPRPRAGVRSPSAGGRPMSARAALTALLLVAALALSSLAPGAARAFEDRSAHVVVDAATGAILSASKPNHPRYPASLTKMMTVLMLFRALDAGTITPDTEIPFSSTAAAANPVKLGLAPGQSVTVAEAIPALIARSANDVAVAVAEHLAGTEALFALEMTRVARTEVGMTRTTFRNASGLPDEDDAHVSTALDMARLARVLWRDHAGRFEAFATETFRFRGQALRSYNGLLRSYEGADGLKTGFTCAAGYNLAGTARRDGQRVISVVMGHASSADRWATSERLLDVGFAALAPPAPEDGAPDGADGGDPETVPTVAAETAETAEGTPAATAQAVRLPALSDLLTLNGLSIPRPLRALPPPDAEGCGGLYAGGWAVTLGAFRSSGQARNLAARAAKVYGGKPLTAPVGTGGMVRHHAFVAALSSGQARSICQQRRARGQYCLVRSPKMMWAAMAAVTRLRRSMR